MEEHTPDEPARTEQPQREAAATVQPVDDAHSHPSGAQQQQAADVDVQGGAEADVAESLNSALAALRKEADQLEAMPLDERKVSAAEHVAESASALDEQIGSFARSDDS